MGPADGGNEGVEALDRQIQARAPDHHWTEPGGCEGVKRLDEIAKPGKKVRRGRQQGFFPPPVRKAFDAVADLGDSDRCGAGELPGAASARIWSELHPAISCRGR